MAVSGNLGGKVAVVDNVLSCDEQEIYPTALLNENCLEFDFQTGRNHYVDLRQTYLDFQVKPVRGRGYETYKRKQNQKGPQRRDKRGRGKYGGGGTSS